ncbi:MAG TPA: L,D-transpeptidase family protein [Steroidobacteraceae bacterium]|nr:L,D-transpeptidase family protein [Steroidobacteraceae bacterium]
MGRLSRIQPAFCLGLSLAFIFCGAAASAAPGGGLVLADHVVVLKAQHRMFLYHGETLLAEYPIELGLNPVGRKEREDDFRTPEGHYMLERRNPHSDYFLSVEVSYPNKQDEKRAMKHHWAPGGEIMVHGLPNSPRYPLAYYVSKNWTNGCIALSDSNMVDFWMRTRDDIPIDIYP